MTLPGDSAREHLAIALDMDDLVAAMRTARPLLDYFAVAKVGLELFSAAGPEAVASLSAEGFQVFVDLKIHDIPTTARRAARVLGALGVAYATVHTSGGLEMVAATADGMSQGAASAGLGNPCVLGVTVLTSDPDAPAEELTRRATIAYEAGCGGVVCAAGDLGIVAEAAPGLKRIVPGIRPAEVSADDQARAATPEAAIRAGADLLVIGRAVTSSGDPVGAAGAIHTEVESALRNAGRL